MKGWISVAVILVLLAGFNARTLCESYCIPARQDASACHDDPETATRLEPTACDNPLAADLFLVTATDTQTSGGLERGALPAHGQIEIVSVCARVAAANVEAAQTGTPPTLVQLRI
jgi:hypothetical protein